MKKDSLLKKLDKLIEKDIIGKIKKQLQEKFKSNMLEFDKHGVLFHHEYKNYIPKEIQLHINEDGEVNLLNINTNNFIYPSAPKHYCQEQVEKYLKKPHHFFNKPSTKGGAYFKEAQYINKIHNLSIKAGTEKPNPFEMPVGMMVINGLGLGYFLDRLITELDIYNLCIIEPNKDLFYASLFILDWKKIFQKFYKTPGHGLQVNVDMNASATLNSIASMFNQIGEHQRLNVLIYHHLNSKAHHEISWDLMCNIANTYTPPGFFEDELISLAHSWQNVKNHIPILSPSFSSNKLEYPVFIIGNGPSLDQQLTFLKQHQDKAVLISCGSTLATLEKNDIVPDIHIEIERTSNTTHSLLGGNTKQYLKKITCVALNSVPYSALKLFKKSFIINKESDAGSLLLDTIANTEIKRINYSNPTVTNMGLSVAINLNFQNITLFGIDLAFSSTNQHHAENSEYYNIENETFTKFSVNTNTFDAPGNFRSSVKTTHELALSARVMGLLLSHHKDIDVININDGIKIPGCRSMQIEKLPPLNNEALPDNYILKLLSAVSLKFDGFTTYDEKSVNQIILSQLAPVINNVTYHKKIHSITDIYQDLNNIIASIRRTSKDNKIANQCLYGTFSSFLGYIYSVIIYIKDDTERRNIYHQSSNLFIEFLTGVLSELETVGLQPDSEQLKTE
jgi:hypothetical protein